MKISKYFVFFILIIHLFLLSQLQFTAWPEMFSFPYMISKGFIIYKDFHHAYQPLLTFVLYLIYKFFGYKLLTLKVFTWVIILLIDFLILLVSYNLFDKKLKSIVPVAIFVMIQPFFDGNMLWFDLAAVPLILLSIYFLLRKNLFWSGFFIALGLLVKQQIVLFLIGYFAYFFLKRFKIKSFLYFAIGGIIPVAITFILFIINGIFNDYLFWTFILPLKYLPHIPGYATLPTINELIILAVLVIPLFFIRGKKRIEIIFFVILLIASFAGSFPRFSFFHLQPMFAIYSILFGMIMISKKRLILFSIPLIIFTYMFIHNRNFFGIEARFYDKSTLSFATIVKTEIKGNQKVYFLGENSLIYVLSDKIPPKPWIENYVWHFEIPGMQEKLLNGWRKDPPYIIFWTKPLQGNWYDLGVYQPKRITDWIMKNYTKKSEVQKGVWEWIRK